ncbi:MAG: hypothetical protein RSB86_11120 [Comamonas sp.]|uniref:hypothetical protein n=1 Tax=Comamonas sp. TaxID=34028 RepID=UPI002FC6BF6E
MNPQTQRWVLAVARCPRTPCVTRAHQKRGRFLGRTPREGFVPTMDGAVESPVVGAAFDEKQQPKILAAC